MTTLIRNVQEFASSALTPCGSGAEQAGFGWLFGCGLVAVSSATRLYGQGGRLGLP
ncbi:hypothetical protein [Tomitella gaofuii]|uniref:hypothetical protein n=1 Tax=Tomitella gaofuii TaxID=2760083 RepID=UPI0020BF3BBF|nr:hypothetical protein [Tomitella gaofuii]